MNKVKNLLPKKAYEIIKNNKDVLFVDIRCYAENKFVGRPKGLVYLVPWIDEPYWEPNPRFAQSIGRLLADKSSPMDTEIILICRSGHRSIEAGRVLLKKGYKKVYHVATGFEGDLDENNQRGNLNGWRHDGLPWVQC